MKNYKFHLKTFLIIIAYASLILTGGVLYLFGELNREELINIILNNSGIILPITVLYAYFEKWGWRHKIWAWTKPLLKIPPNVRGRWEGTLYRITDGHQEGFTIEIIQTMTKLQVYTYSERNSESESILDEIASDIQHEKNFKLCYLWEGKANNLPGQPTDSGKFMGYTILKLIEVNGSKELIGEYFTDRKPTETQGVISVKWVSKNLKRKFK